MSYAYVYLFSFSSFVVVVAAAAATLYCTDSFECGPVPPNAEVRSGSHRRTPCRCVRLPPFTPHARISVVPSSLNCTNEHDLPGVPSAQIPPRLHRTSTTKYY